MTRQAADHLASEFEIERFRADLLSVNQDLATSIPLDFIRERQTIPLRLIDREPVLGIVNPFDGQAHRQVEEQTGLHLNQVLMSKSEFAAAFQRLLSDEHLRISTSDLLTRFPEDSASRVLTSRQRYVILAGAILGVTMLGLWPLGTLIAVVAAINLIYLGVSIHKLYLTHHAYGHDVTTDISSNQLAAIEDAELPIYTLLIPLYRETAVLPTLVEAIGRMDYPKEKLDVKLLLETDDTETIRVAEGSDLPDYFEIVVVPNGKPKGKPRACNYGLSLARGTYVVIYDAEDVPEADQLKKVVLAFRQGDNRLGCVQCKLNYYNQHQNLLTRWFTAEYSMWFDLFLPALVASGSPIPLGGTSNHFPTKVLRELGAWDPFNVTEDADLGIRLYRRGFQTAIVNSTTWEEANSNTRNWILQRSRWIKGYVQTWLVHMRHPIALHRALGPKAWLSFQASIGGTFFVLLMNPIFWLLTLVWYFTRFESISSLFPTPIFFLGSISLFIGNFLYIFGAMMGCLNRGYHSLVKYSLLLPLYWILMSLAAWKGCTQLLYKPSYWEKTAHGLYRGPIFTGDLGTVSVNQHPQPQAARTLAEPSLPTKVRLAPSSDRVANS